MMLTIFLFTLERRNIIYGHHYSVLRPQSPFGVHN